MVWWQLFGFFWFVLGVANIGTLEFAFRLNQSQGPLSQEHILTSIGYCAALIVGAPLVAVFAFGVCAHMFWKGRIPITDRVWWPARADHFASKKPPPTSHEPIPPSREDALCEMVEIRQRQDLRLRQREEPSNWPMFELWRTIEASILDTVEQYLWLCDGGLSGQRALEKIEVHQKGKADFSVMPNATLQSYIQHRLAVVDPDYLTLGCDSLSEVLQAAEKWAADEIQRIKSGRPFPPATWLKERVNVSEIESGESLPMMDGGLAVPALYSRVAPPRATILNDKDWKRIKLRMLPTDELRTFSSPAAYWQGLAGRMGVALIRDGHPIGHVITMMN